MSSDDLEILPALPGVYVIYVLDGAIPHLCYIGSSIDIRSRIKSHIRGEYEKIYRGGRKVNLVLDNLHKMDMIVDGTETYLIKYKVSKKIGEWLMREYRLVYRLRPPCNKRITIIPEIEAYVLANEI